MSIINIITNLGEIRVPAQVSDGIALHHTVDYAIFQQLRYMRARSLAKRLRAMKEWDWGVFGDRTTGQPAGLKKRVKNENSKG